MGSYRLSVFLIKLKSVVYQTTGLEIQILQTIATKGVINTATSIIVSSILRYLYKGYDLIGSIIIGLAIKVPKEKVPLPPIGDRSVLREPVGSISEKIRSQKITSEEVVRTFIARILEVNASLTSVVDERFEIALEEARRIDKLIQSGEFDELTLRVKFPLLGVPFTIKDSFCVESLKHTAGLYYRKDFTAPQDAEVVKTLKLAGAIPIGVTNVSELCMWWESVNTVYGRSKNPYDTRHITGGSSGGEAALQGAAGSAFGIGSDIGGSIRMPAFFCGVYGHKPTVGLVSNVGQEPKTTGRIAEFLSTGPLTRHAQDLPLLLDVLVGEQRLKLSKVPELKTIRIFYMEDDGGSPLATPIHNELKMAMHRVLKHYELKFGIKAQKANITKLYHSLEIWASGMSGAGAPTFCEELALREGKINPFWEIIKWVFRYSPHTFPALILGMLEKLAYAGTATGRHKEMIEMGYSLAKEVQELLGQDGIMLYPSHPSPAPRHFKPMFRPADFSYTAIFNVIGVPVTQVPLGLGSDGLPLGVQVVGGMFNDLLTIEVAKECETAFGGWIPPCAAGSTGNLTSVMQN